MHIALVTPTFSPQKNGMARAAVWHARLLSELGHTCVVFAPSEIVPNTTLGQESFRVFPVPSLFSYGHGHFTPKLRTLLQGADLVFLEYPAFGMAEFVYCFVRKYHGRLVLFYHMDVLGQRIFRSFFYLYTKYMLPRFVCAADRVCVSSRDYAEHSQVARTVREHPEKICEIPFPVDLERFSPRKKQKKILAQHHLHGNTKILLFVGALDRAHYFKGVMILLDAWKIFLEKKCQKRTCAPDVYALMIVGDGNMRSVYQTYARKLGIAKNVVFTGFVSEEVLPFYYNCADAVVLPSLNQSESFGIALLESLASDVPIIASSLPGVRMLINSETGVMVSPGNVRDLAHAIRTVLSHRTSFSPRRFAEQFFSKKQILSALDRMLIKYMDKDKKKQYD